MIHARAVNISDTSERYQKDSKMVSAGKIREDMGSERYYLYKKSQSVNVDNKR
jgi:hypothetical protein